MNIIHIIKRVFYIFNNLENKELQNKISKEDQIIINLYKIAIDYYNNEEYNMSLKEFERIESMGYLSDKLNLNIARCSYRIWIKEYNHNYLLKSEKYYIKCIDSDTYKNNIDINRELIEVYTCLGLYTVLFIYLECNMLFR